MTDPDAAIQHRRARRKRRARRWGVGSLAGLALLGCAALVAGFVLMGRTLTAPDWIAAEVEARASQAGLSVAFDRMEFVVNKGWRPRARLTELTIADASGAEIARLASIEASLAMRPLLRGEVQARHVEIDGVFANLRRAPDGTITLSGGTRLGVARRAENLPELIRGLDAVLEHPRLRELRSAQVFGLTLQFEDARADRAWTADGGQLRLTREGDDLTMAANLALLGGGAGVATLEANYASRIGETAASFGVRLGGVRARDIATQGPALAWLAALRAPISGALRSGVLPDGTLAPLSATLQIGTGALQPNAATRPIPFDSARTYFTYDAATGVMQVDELSVQSDWLTGRAEGQAVLQADGAFEALIGQFRAEGLRFNPYRLYDTPRALTSVALDFRLTLDPFRLELGEALVRDRGQSLTASGDLTAEAEGWRFALDGRMDAVERDRVLALWPPNLVPRTRAWVDENLATATLTGLDLALRGAPGRQTDTYLSFDFNGAQIRYAASLPPITGGAGNASLLGGRFAVTLDTGTVTPPRGGPVDVAASSFIIPDVTIDDGPPAVARLRTRGSVTAALSLLDQEPLSILTRAGLPVDLASGQADLTGTLSLPLIRDLRTEQIRFDAAGTLTGVETESLVPGQILAAPLMQLTASNDGVRLAGQGTLSGIPFDAAWTQPLGNEAPAGSRVDGRIELSARALDTFGITLPPGSIAGQGSGDISVTLPPGAPPRLTLGSDLRGLRMALAPVGWSKPAGTGGQFRLDATLGRVPDITRIALDAAGLSASGRIDLTASGALARASFDRVRLGDWLDAPVTIEGRGPGQPPGIRLGGGRIDLRNASLGTGSAGSTGGSGASGPLSLRLDSLQIADTIAITEMTGEFTTARGLDGRFTGRMNGGARVSGQVVPQNGRTAIRLRADDAGGVFASAGIIRQARGGALDLTLLPVGQDGAFDGTLRVTNTRIKDAPAIADLLSAISIIGLLEQLSGDGILFTEVDAAFRLTPSVLTLASASAVGPSIGISMDGRYGIAGEILDMQGVVSPVYLLNGIGALFTRKGEGLIGFSYRLTGSAQDPAVSVNALSALTPGLFREIFRRPPPEIPAGDDPAETPRAFAPDGPAPPAAPQAAPGPTELLERAEDFEGR